MQEVDATAVWDWLDNDVGRDTTFATVIMLETLSKSNQMHVLIQRRYGTVKMYPTPDGHIFHIYDRA